MAEKLNTGPKARYNQETGEWEDLNSPAPLPELKNEVIPEPIEPETMPIPGEETIDDQPNAETLYADVELLGKSYPVRRMIHEAGNQSLHGTQAVLARLRNTISTPGKLRKSFSRSLAERRFNRHKERLDSLSHLDDSNRLKQRRQAKLLRVQTRLGEKQANYDEHTNTMKKRVDVVGEKAIDRREQKISSLKQRRDIALGRRAMRHEVRSQGASFHETRAIVKGISQDHMARVGNLAATARLSERRATVMENVGMPAYDAKLLAQQHAAERDQLAKETSKA